MNLIQTLLILIIFVLLGAMILKQMSKPKVVKKYYVEPQHPIYPFIQYDIREVLPPSRRTYMRYPYYFHRNGMFMR
jgi:hypothetical protein